MCECAMCKPKGFTYTEEFRHQSETRMVANMPSHQARGAYLKGVEEKRGWMMADRLRTDVWRLMRGDKLEPIEAPKVQEELAL